MLHLTCYAVVKRGEARQRLLNALNRKCVPFTVDATRVSVDAHFCSYKSVDQVLEYFEQTDAEERGFSLMSYGKEVVDHDSG